MLDDKTKEKVKDHVLNHHDGFPQTKDQLVQLCNNMSEFDEKVKEWFAKTLPAGTYNSGEEVLKALGL